MLSIANNEYAFRLGCKNASRTIFCSCYLFDDNRGCRPAGCLLGVAGVSLDASGHVVRRAGRGLWPTMANLRKNEYVFIFARFSAFMVLRAPFAPPPLKWPVAASHCGRLTATLPTPKINGPMDDEDHFFFFFVWRFGACFLGGGTSACFRLVCGRFCKASPSAFLFGVLGSFRPALIARAN